MLGGFYIALIVAMVFAEAYYTSPSRMLAMFRNENIQFAIKLSFVTCGITTILCLWVGAPLAYILSRWDDTPFARRLDRIALDPMIGRMRCGWWWIPVLGLPWLLLRMVRRPRAMVDALVDVPLVLPPLVVGICLLILFETPWLRAMQRVHFTLFGEEYSLRITYGVPAVIIAQFAVSCAFAVRTLKVTFDQISPRNEQVALTLGCNRFQAFWRVLLPEARGGIVAAAAISWARSLGEFGPILVFAGATRLRTEVLSTSVFLHFSVGELGDALAVSLMMIIAAVAIMATMRALDAGPQLS